MKQLTDEQETEIGQAIIDLFGLRTIPGTDGMRFKTSWGSKTALGIARSVFRVIENTTKEELFKN